MRKGAQGMGETPGLLRSGEPEEQDADWAAIRDSKDPDGGALVLTPAQWTAFADAVRNDRLTA